MKEHEMNADQPAPATGIFPILVVDDDHGIRQSLQWTLEDEGFTVDTAGDGSEAAARAAARPPALVILDYGLPATDGATVAKELRASCGAQLPILLITADGRAAEKAQRAGAHAYLHQPFDLDELVELVQSIVRGEDRDSVGQS